MLEGDNLEKYCLEWDDYAAKWAEGLQEDGITPNAWKPIEPEFAGQTYAEVYGERPDPAHYMPNWPQAERTHWQMYETVSDTPISKVHETPEAVARELAQTGVWGGYDYQTWLSMIRAGWAPTMMFTPEHGAEEGVVFAARAQNEKEARR